MKAIISIGVILMIMMVSVFEASAQENKKAANARKDVKEAKEDVKEAKDNVKVAQQDLVEAKQDSAADFQQFKKESLAQIAENKKRIAELKVKKVNDNKDAQKNYNKRVLSLEQKNDALKKRIDESNATQPSMWTSFKREFSHDMGELGRAFRDIGVDSKK